MNQTLKIIIAAIITAVIVGIGVYYWKSSNSSFQTETTEESSDVTDELPIANKPRGRSKEDIKVKTDESTNKTADWKTYTSIGVSIRYPNDGTYTVDEKGPDPDLEGFTITQKHPGNRIHVYKTNDLSVLSDDVQTKVINGRTYKVFYREGLGSGYRYVIEHNGQFYVFESVWGPQNEVFELMMTTVELE